jgi:hypothetical protein
MLTNIKQRDPSQRDHEREKSNQTLTYIELQYHLCRTSLLHAASTLLMTVPSLRGQIFWLKNNDVLTLCPVMDHSDFSLHFRSLQSNKLILKLKKLKSECKHLQGTNLIECNKPENTTAQLQCVSALALKLRRLFGIVLITGPSECGVTINFELNWDLFYFICNASEWCCVSIISASARAHARVMRPPRVTNVSFGTHLVTCISPDSARAFQLLLSTRLPLPPVSPWPTSHRHPPPSLSGPSGWQSTGMCEIRCSSAEHQSPVRCRWRGRRRWSSWRLAPITRSIPSCRCHDVG